MHRQLALNDLRRYGRVMFAAKAMILGTLGDFAGRTSDVSSGGARIEVTTYVPGEVIDKVTSIRIEDVGQFDCEVRWRAARAFGVEFRNPLRASLILGDALRRQGHLSDRPQVAMMEPGSKSGREVL